MNLYNFCFVIVVLCGVFEQSQGTNLNCQFGTEDYYTGRIYSCDVRTLDNTNNTMVITGHSSIKRTDVKGIHIINTNTKFIPRNLGLLFNITALWMYNTQLVEIKFEDFVGMQDLKELYLGNNLIEEIPNGVFSNNLKLEQIFLHQNKIKFLGSNLFDGLTKLNRVEFGAENDCIYGNYEGSTRIIQLKNDIKNQCINPKEIPAINPIEKLFVEIDDQISRIKEELITEFVDATEEHQHKLIKLVLKNSRINCQFRKHKFLELNSYTCVVTSLDNNVTEIAGYFGNHDDYKKDSDVEGIYIENTNTKYIPSGLGSLFNLIAFEMRKTQLFEIKSEDFHGMEMLQQLRLPENRLTSIPVDAFSTLTKLKTIDLVGNKLEEISNGVFSFNFELEYIYLGWNKIKFLGSSLFSGLTQLNRVSLRSNVCINIHYDGNTDIIKLKNDIKIKCYDPNELPPMNSFKLFFAEIKYQISRVKEEFITEFVAGTEEHHEKLIEMLTEAAEAEEMEEEESDEDWF